MHEKKINTWNIPQVNCRHRNVRSYILEFFTKKTFCSNILMVFGIFERSKGNVKCHLKDGSGIAKNNFVQVLKLLKRLF